jgi:hypothetical protein
LRAPQYGSRGSAPIFASTSSIPSTSPQPSSSIRLSPVSAAIAVPPSNGPASISLRNAIPPFFLQLLQRPKLHHLYTI